jgi:hypothetical protein
MRTIKFKGQRVDTHKWVFGFLYINNTTGVYYIIQGQLVRSDGEKPIADFDYYEVLPETVCQFTGLYDLKKDEIYEGDILHEPYQKNHDVYVVFEDGRFSMIYMTTHSYFYQGDTSNILFCEGNFKNAGRVIRGSIHDKHELLSEAKS